MKNAKYMKFKIVVIIVLLFITVTAAVYFHSSRNEVKEYSGLFVHATAHEMERV